MPQLRLPTTGKFLSFGGFLLLALLLAACGAAGASATTASPSSREMNASVQSQSQTTGGVATNNQVAKAPATLRMPQNIATQHLIKTLNVTLSVKDTRQAANDLQAWIGATDPQATSIGTNYNEITTGVYNITLNFSVEYTLYPKIYSYLSNYAPKDGGRLVSLNESVQDVTNDYVDTQARIANDQNELQRLRALMQQTGSLSDVLAVEQQITATEGDIETTQAHLNQLNNQTTMYTVNITLQPLSSDIPPVQPDSGWNVGQTVHNALSASLAFGQALVNFIIWLLAFSIYLIPVVVLIVLYRRYRARHPLTHQPAQSLYYQPLSSRASVKPFTPPQPSAPSQPVAVGATVGAPEEAEAEEEATPSSPED